MVSDEEHFDPSESILKDSLNTIKSEMDYFANTIIELKGKKVKIPLLGKEQEGGCVGFRVDALQSLFRLG